MTFERLSADGRDFAAIYVAIMRYRIKCHPESVEGGRCSYTLAMEPCVYILEVCNGSFYVGSTSNLEQRIAQHHQGVGSKWTAARRPVRVVYTQEFSTMREAVEAERQLKGWRRAKKTALIRGDWDMLPELSKSYARLSILRRTQDDI